MFDTKLCFCHSQVISHVPLLYLYYIVLRCFTGDPNKNDMHVYVVSHTFVFPF